MGFRPEEIGNETGGCNPIPVGRSIDGQMVVLKAKDLEAGAQYSEDFYTEALRKTDLLALSLISVEKFQVLIISLQFSVSLHAPGDFKREGYCGCVSWLILNFLLETHEASRYLVEQPDEEKGRTFFLVSGLAIGIGAAVAMTSVGDAMNREVMHALDEFGANILVLPASEGLPLSYGGLTVSAVTPEEETYARGRGKNTVLSRTGRISAPSRRKLLVQTEVKGTRS